MKKSKKILALVCSATAAFAAAGLFAACADEPVATHEHEWGEWTVTTEATCTDEGTETRVCALDGTHKESRKIDALDHAWGDWADETDATCTAAKTQKRVCSRNHEHTQTQSVGEPLGHAMADTWQYTLPETGKKGAAVKTCTRTGCEEEERVELPELTNEDYEVSTTATCTAAGKTTYTIVIDEETFSFSVDTAALGHRNLTKTDEVSANCTQNGTQAYWTCSCGQKFADAQGEQEIDEPVAIPAGHGTLKATQETPSTCTTAGTAAYWTCEVCKQKFGDAQGTQEIDAPAALPLAAHTPVAKAAVPSTCKTEGTAAYWECGVCEKKFANEACTEDITAPETLPLAAHTYEVTVTDGENGKKVVAKVCSACTATEGEPQLVDEELDITSTTAAKAQTIGRKDYFLRVDKGTSRMVYVNFIIDAAGSYKLEFSFFSSAVLGLASVTVDGTDAFKSNAVQENFKDKLFVERDGTTSSSKLNSLEFVASADDVGKTVLIGLGKIQTGNHAVLKTTMPEEPAKVLNEGDNKLFFKNTDAVLYTFTPSETKIYSLTVPVGFAVYPDENGEPSYVAFIDNGDGSASAGQNFDAVANETIKWWILAPSAQVFTVTIGARISLPTVTPDSPLNNISIDGRGVYECEVGEIEAGNYTLKINLGTSAMRSAFCFGKNIAPNWNDNFAANGNTLYTTAESTFQFPQAQVLNGAPYEASVENRTTWVIKLDLQAGDRLVFMNGGSTGAAISITLEKTV